MSVGGIMLFKLYCPNCGNEYGINESIWKCSCGNYLNIKVEPDFSFDFKKVKVRSKCLWRYRELIPIEKDENIVSFNEGFTPIVKMRKNIFLKLDYMFPTGSFKDRGATVLISKLKEIGVKSIVEDSSGNAGIAISAYSAAAKIKCSIYVPEIISEEKYMQLKIYGAKVVKIKGTREDVAKEALKEAEKTYYAGHNWNPFFIEGTKTIAYEIFEQIGVPDNIIVPIGGGSLILGIYKGFKELESMGIIDKMPKLCGVQSDVCKPIYYGLLGKEPKDTIKGEVLAEGIAVNKPPRGKEIVKAIKETEGNVITVNNNEIIQGILELGKMGIFAEITSGVVMPALKKANLEEDEVTVAIITGNGLKTVSKLAKILSKYK